MNIEVGKYYWLSCTGYIDWQEVETVQVLSFYKHGGADYVIVKRRGLGTQSFPVDKLLAPVEKLTWWQRIFSA